MTRPSTLPEWATSGDRATISTGERSTGYAYGQVVPFDLLNGQLGELGDWVVYLDETATDHESRVVELEDTATLAADGVALADLDSARPYTIRQATSGGPGLIVSGTQVAIASSSVIDVACDGEYVWVAYVTGSNYFVRRYSRATMTIDAAWNLTTGTTAIQCIACAGGDLFIGRTTNLVRASRSDSTTTLVVLAAGGTVTDVATNGAAVWIATGNTVRQTTVAISTWAWTYDHGAAVRAVAAIPTRTSGSSDTVVAAVGEPGSTALGVLYGGIILSSTGTVTGRYMDDGTEVDGLRAVASNGRRIAWSSQGVVYCSDVWSLAGLPEQRWKTTVASNNLTSLYMTERDVFAVDPTDDVLHALAQSDGAHQWQYAPSTVLKVAHVAADVFGIVIGGDSTGTYQLQRMTDGHPHRLCVKATATDTARWPYHQLLVPLGGA